MINTKNIGNIGEVKTICKFVELGIPVYTSFGDNESADMIAEFNGKLQKIQCKTSQKLSEGNIVVGLTTNYKSNTILKSDQSIEVASRS